MRMRNGEGGMRSVTSTLTLRFRIPHSAFRIGLLASLSACSSPTATPCEPAAQCRIVTIPRGATFDAAVDSLVAHGIVTHPTTFHWYARLHGLPGSLKSGTYGFHADEGWSELVDALTRYTATICTRRSVTSGATASRIGRRSGLARSTEASVRASRAA